MESKIENNLTLFYQIPVWGPILIPSPIFPKHLKPVATFISIWHLWSIAGTFGYSDHSQASMNSYCSALPTETSISRYLAQSHIQFASLISQNLASQYCPVGSMQITPTIPPIQLLHSITAKISKSDWLPYVQVLTFLPYGFHMFLFRQWSMSNEKVGRRYTMNTGAVECIMEEMWT